jgi:dTDP-4-dehydrorhamnose 3,5-epimerase
MSHKIMEVERSAVFDEVIVFKPSVFWDQRGNIYTSFHDDNYQPHLKDGLHFVHDKFAQSKHNVLRGLHGDNKTWKLVSCVWGEIDEVIADMRPNSPTYRQWEMFKLRSDNYQQVLIPPGFVNGYYVHSEDAVFHYKLAYDGEYIDADGQLTVIWNDPQLNIQWNCTDPILQDRDK